MKAKDVAEFFRLTPESVAIMPKEYIESGGEAPEPSKTGFRYRTDPKGLDIIEEAFQNSEAGGGSFT